MGTILLNVCELIERPSKKDGFCFKLFHPLDQNIWATRGPLGESHGAVTLNPMPATHLICRAPSVSVSGFLFAGLTASPARALGNAEAMASWNLSRFLRVQRRWQPRKNKERGLQRFPSD